jgi:hypothetical protein
MRLALLALLVVPLLGCGSNLASVGGTVTLDGRPLAGSDKLRGTVQFSPEGGGGTAAVGYLDENGRYNLSSGSRVGVLPGKYLVSVSATEIIPPKIPGEAPSGRLATPRQYADAKNSGFTAEVAAGSNTFDFALSSQRSK